MAVIKPFKGLRPVKEKAAMIASRPYDVLNSQEARVEAEGNPYSFLHVVKPEIDLPEDTDAHAAEVYRKGRENFWGMVDQGIFRRDDTDCLYVYAQTMNGKTQYGLVAGSSVEDYFTGVIKKHELTRPDKEWDRMTHVKVTRINAGPVFLTYPDHSEVDAIIKEVIKGEPDNDFTASDGVQHKLWVINDPSTIDKLVVYFAGIPFTYIADGHHRTASAALVGKACRLENPSHTGEEAYNFFLTVLFPAGQLTIIDYNRVVKNLNGHSVDEFLEKVKANFEVEDQEEAIYKPRALHSFGMYLDKHWYSLKAREGTYNDHDPIKGLDVTVLSENILDPILGIEDLRTDKRIDFVGGIRGLEELVRRVDSGEMKLAFALYPVSIQQLIHIADTNNIMPPKTTWFEPKLRSGLVVYDLS